MSLYALMRGDPPWNKAAVLRQLAELNIAKLEVEFSGGNDDGGVDSRLATTAEGVVVQLPEYTYDHEFDPIAKRWGDRVLTPDEVTANRLLEAIDRPIDHRYGSFAGDFHVSGTLHYDVPAGRVWIGGSEDTPSSQGFADEL